MKICFIELLPYPENIGGGSSYITGLGKALIKKGHDVTVLTTRDDEELVYHVYDGIKVQKLGMVRRLRKDYSGISFVFFLFQRLFFELWFILLVAKYLRRNTFDLVNAQSPIHGAIAARLANVDYTITAHGIYSEGHGDGFLRRLFELIEINTVKNSWMTVCLGRRTRNYYEKYGNTIIIPGGVDIKQFTYDESIKNNKTIVYAGRFSKIKRVDGIIKAMDYLPKYKLIVIGHGPEGEKIVRECVKRRNVRFKGKRGTEYVQQVMGFSRFVVLNSSIEGLPIMLMEGMASGCIPITTMSGDIDDLVNDGNGTIIKPGAKNIAKAIKSYEKKNVPFYSKRARITIEREFDWDSIAAKWQYYLL